MDIKVTVRQSFPSEVYFKLYVPPYSGGRPGKIATLILEAWSDVTGLDWKGRNPTFEVVENGFRAKSPLINRPDVDFFWEESD